MKKACVIIGIGALLFCGMCSEKGKKDDAQAVKEVVEQPKPIDENGNFDFNDTDIKEVMAHFIRNYGISFVFDPDLQRKITYKKNQIRWDKALDEILEAHSLAKDRKENVIRVYQPGIETQK